MSASSWQLVGLSEAAKKRGTLPLSFGENTVGRSSVNTIQLASSKCSKRHCTITVNETKILLLDNKVYQAICYDNWNS